jgi:hypothetical protein
VAQQPSTAQPNEQNRPTLVGDDQLQQNQQSNHEGQAMSLELQMNRQL